mmetsp:Transcript_44575/g.95778  ORF Transcript_44575/g.95778 Transcript_44575/m.95778 type:complete len:83 (+) Transcript_44575:1250-1498(+)
MMQVPILPVSSYLTLRTKADPSSPQASKLPRTLNKGSRPTYLTASAPTSNVEVGSRSHLQLRGKLLAFSLPIFVPSHLRGEL